MTYSNRIKVEATAGLGDATLGTPIDSFVAFPDGSTSYTILSEDDKWETGTGTVSDNLLTRLVVEENHLGNTDFVDFTSLELQIAQTISGGNYNRKPDVFHQKDAPTEYRVGDIWLPELYNQLFVARGDIPITDEFVIVMRTTTDNETITLPATGTNNFSINWGDQTVETITTTSPTHEYATAGDYTIIISGTCPVWFFNNNADAKKLIAVNNLGIVGWEVLAYGFKGCTSLDLFVSGNTDTSNVSNFADFMSNTLSLYDTPDLTTLDTSSAESMASMLDYMNKITVPPDISNFSTSNVTNMYRMFRNWASCLTPPDLSGFDTAKVVTLSTAMANWIAMGEIDIPIDTWDIGVCSNMTDMLSGTTLTTECYDRTLIAWAAQTVQPDVVAHFGNSKYSAASEAARNTLTLNNNWTITDGGPA